MNIFGIGIAELLLILLIALVVAGPKRMIRWAYVAGVYAAKLRDMWTQAVEVLQKEVDDAGLDVTIPRELPTRQNLSRVVTDLARPYTQEMTEAAQGISNPIKEAASEAQQAARLAQQNIRNEQPQPSQNDTLGTWGANHSTQSPEPDEKTGFGAWSNPQHPGQQGK